jgi:hypothetical protein
MGVPLHDISEVGSVIGVGVVGCDDGIPGLTNTKFTRPSTADVLAGIALAAVTIRGPRRALVRGIETACEWKVKQAEAVLPRPQ